jgi:hypothetical protein
MVFDPPRPRRRARWLVPLLIGTVAAVAFAASNIGSDRAGEIEYLNQIADQSEQLALGGEALRDVTGRLETIDRSEFITAVDNLRAELLAGTQFLAEEPPTEELFAVRSLYRLALEEWNQGVGGLATGILGAADNPDSTEPVGTITGAIVALTSGDALFGDLREELDRLDVPDPVRIVREVVLSPSPGEPVTLAISFTESARSVSNGLALRPGLAASSIVVDPEWQLNPDNVPVMPATDVASFSVIVTNVGNLLSLEETLSLTLTPVESGESIVLTLPIPPLAPGASTTVAFDPMPVSPGESYEVLAVINVTEADIDFQDNELSVTFRVNAE